MLSITNDFSPLSEFGHAIQQTVMTIIAKIHDQLIPVGTGFIIQPDGLMMTAAHVLEEVKVRALRELNEEGEFYDYAELYTLYISNETHGNNNEYIGGLWPIDKAWWSKDTDIGFCLLKKATINDKPFLFRPVRLSVGVPKVGENILGFGYYKMDEDITDTMVDEESLSIILRTLLLQEGK